MNKDLLRSIPKVDELLKTLCLDQCPLPPAVLTQSVRVALEELRSAVLEDRIHALPDAQMLRSHILSIAYQAHRPSLRRVINATGVVLHTNLGRACLSARAVEAVVQTARGYSTLEYDVSSGGRGERYVHVESLLQTLTSAESAMVVNNNAAAVLLILSAITAGGEVVTSRGELVEIGGSFRIPEIMECCGAQLRAVGTTNKTHLWDYENAINERTRALMKVHTSNFKIVGFSQSVPLEELTSLAHKRGLPVIEDLGSGSLCDLEQFGIHDEPTVQRSVRAGVDVISFSGDKLLGGPQAGIIIGKREYIQALKRHPLTRAMRVDKMTLAALEATLRSYDEHTFLDEIPTLSMLGTMPQLLKQRARQLCDMMLECGIHALVVSQTDQVGGGSVPTQLLPTYAVAISPARGSINQLEQSLRSLDCPIIGRIANAQYLLDVRTLFTEDFAYIVQSTKEAAL